MKKIFFLPKYYTIEIEIKTGIVEIFSSSKHAKGRKLNQKINHKGYLVVYMNGKTHLIHSLVANFILGKRPHGLCVNHIDGNKLNNSPSNLEYVTLSENTKHSIRTGLHVCNRPDKMGMYIDGRCSDIVKYKKDWYLKNRERILIKEKEKYNAKKQFGNQA
jgi:hypothetical protein